MTEQAQDYDNGLKLHHNLIKLNGKIPSDIVGERHDIVLLIEVTKSNPNGDPDTGNMPRMQPDTMKGLMTDVCQKRKIRNFFTLYNPDSSLRMEEAGWKEGWRIFIREGAILQEQIEHPDVNSVAEAKFRNWILSEIPVKYRQTITNALAGVEAQGEQKKDFKDIVKKYQAAWKEWTPPETSKSGGTEDGNPQSASPGEITEKKAKKKEDNPLQDAFDKVLKKSSEYRERFLRDALCATYFDVRFFGGVASTTGPLDGSFYGQIRGPIQFGFAESLDRVLPLDFTITRCAATKKQEKGANQAGEAEGEGESGGNRTMGRKHVVDYGIYRSHIYFSPAFAAKTGFTYYDFDNFLFALQHMFTDDRAASRPGGMRVIGLIDFQHSTALGNEHAHKLFDMVKVYRCDHDTEGKRKEFPHSIADYCGEAPAGAVREKDQGGEGNALITARKIIWEIPACQKSPAAAV